MLLGLDMATLEALDEQDDLHLMGALTTVIQSDIAPYLERIDAPLGQVLIQQGEPPRGLYFLVSGQVTAQRETESGPVRLRCMGPGTVVGELGVYLNRPTTASVVANQESVLYFLPNERFQDLEKSDPAAAAELHRLMVQLVGERLLFSLSTLQALSK